MRLRFVSNWDWRYAENDEFFECKKNTNENYDFAISKKDWSSLGGFKMRIYLFITAIFISIINTANGINIGKSDISGANE